MSSEEPVAIIGEEPAHYSEDVGPSAKMSRLDCYPKACDELRPPPVYDDCINPYPEICCRKVRCQKPIYNPPTPLDWKLCNGIGRMMIYICGVPRRNFRWFSFNFCCDAGIFCDVALSIATNENDCDKGTRRNTRRDREWEIPETKIPCFAFKPNVSFDMIISVESDKYRVAVNGQHHFDYSHRMKNFWDINRITIEGDLSIKSFQICYY